MPLSKEQDKERKRKKCPTCVQPKIPDSPDGWKDVKAYVQRESSGMPNLERLQRIAGSLGSQAGEVMFGVTGIMMEDIGSVVGVEGAKYGKAQ